MFKAQMYDGPNWNVESINISVSLSKLSSNR